MSDALRVLIVEDSESDAKLVLSELRRSGRQLVARRVQDEAAMRQALTSTAWDLIVSDWSMPSFDALLALRTVKELELDIPFVIVSGTVGEDMAVQAMRAGANDYVLKDNLTRLLPAVDRELRECRMRAEHRASAQALRESEQQLRQAVKMEALGRLAAGVAHDFNNLLSVILGYSELLLNELHEGDPIRREVSEIDAAASRAAELTRQLLVFSRQHVAELETLELNELLSALESMLRRVLGEDIELSLGFCEESCRVQADRGNLEQVILNLVVNARDAMPRGGRLSIGLARVELDEAAVQRAPLGLRAGSYVQLSVSDTGIGMTAETQARIFEPFFTTKDKNVGTGLGLSTVLGIVQQSGGGITVASELERGTTFKILWPVSTQPSTRSNAPSDRPLPRGNETILLVEDEAAVRTVAARILRVHGYEVLEASTPSEALMISDSHTRPIHLLLTDVVMPKLSGPVLAAELCARRGELRVLYMSGYTDDSRLRHGVLEDEVAYLQKPLTASSLTRKVRELLSRQR